MAEHVTERWEQQLYWQWQETETKCSDSPWEAQNRTWSMKQSKMKKWIHWIGRPTGQACSMGVRTKLRQEDTTQLPPWELNAENFWLSSSPHWSGDARNAGMLHHPYIHSSDHFLTHVKIRTATTIVFWRSEHSLLCPVPVSWLSTILYVLQVMLKVELDQIRLINNFSWRCYPCFPRWHPKQVKMTDWTVR